MDNLKINIFKEYFKGRDVFGIADIADFYNQMGECLTHTNRNWRIFTLAQKGIIQRVGKGRYTLGTKKNYIPEISSKLRSIYNKIHKTFPFTNICVWNTSVFNEFMQHQPNKFYTLIEVEKETMEAVFYFLKEDRHSVFLNPTAEILEKYLPTNKDIFIVKSLISESPIIETKGICTASIEKILVDVFCNNILFATQQGNEMQTIFSNVFEQYIVNQSKMLRYASRRKKKNELENYLKSIPNFRQ